MIFYKWFIGTAGADVMILPIKRSGSFCCFMKVELTSYIRRVVISWSPQDIESDFQPNSKQKQDMIQLLFGWNG
jgi:hypothetical protein